MIARLRSYLNPLAWWTWISENPVIQKEMRSRMRGWRAIAGLTAFLVLIGGTVAMIYFGFATAGGLSQGVTVRKTIGQSVFYTIYVMQLFIVAITAPGLTAGGIAIEREHQTYDLLRTTLLSARALVTGKLLAAVSFTLILIIASVPLQSLGFIFGGVSLGEVVVGTVILVLTALNFGAVGLFFSSLVRRARIATVLSQITTMTFTVGLPILALVSISVIEALYYNSLSRPPEWLLLGLGWLIAIGSPIATAVVTEVILVNEQTLFFFNTSSSLSGFPFSAWVPSPWLGFVLLYGALTLAFIALTVRVIKRPDRQ